MFSDHMAPRPIELHAVKHGVSKSRMIFDHAPPIIEQTKGINSDYCEIEF